MMIRFHINVLCFCDGSAFMWGFCFAPTRHSGLDPESCGWNYMYFIKTIDNELFIYIRISVRRTP